MTQIATIEKILADGKAQISVARQSACAHDCHECAGCGATAAPVFAVANNAVGAAIGQKVVVESSSKKLFGVMLVVYMLPLALFFVGYFCSAAIRSEGVRYLIGALAFCLGVLCAVFYDRRIKKSGGLEFTIVRTL